MLLSAETQARFRGQDTPRKRSKLVILTGKTRKASVHMRYRHFKDTHNQVLVKSGEATMRVLSLIQPLALLTSSVLPGMLVTLLSLGFLVHTVEFRIPTSQGYCTDLKS